MGLIVGDKVDGVSLHHNLLAHNDQRNPRLKSNGITDFVNNVIYNPREYAGWASDAAKFNYVNNFFKAGFNTFKSRPELVISIGNGNVQAYVAGNIGWNRTDDTMDEWQAVGGWSGHDPSKQVAKVTVPFPAPVVTTQSATAVYNEVLADVGVNARLDCKGNLVPNSDNVDQRIISDVLNGTGKIIDDPSEKVNAFTDSGGWPLLDPGTACPDSDKDGMPNQWELIQGFNPNDPTDGPLDSNGNGYTNVEEFLNLVDLAAPPPPPPPPTNLAPSVNAGNDQIIFLPSNVSLNGIVTDDGLPTPPGSLLLTWSKVSGPGNVIFSDKNMSHTKASFSSEGTYVLRLTADDGALTSSDDITITVNPPQVLVPAFPGAEGFGAKSIGGRGGRVIEVTNLNDSGPGSFREALDASGPRIVVFRIGGTIELKSRIRITNSFLTIAGQTAPGGGISLKYDPEFLIGDWSAGTHDIIIRYVRFRHTANIDNQDAINILSGSHDIILDHISASWGTDETVSVITQSHDVTIQWSIISESIFTKGGNNKGSLFSSGAYDISAHHNLYSQH